MSILGTDAYRLALATALANAQTSLSLVSAYITVPGITWILDRSDPSPRSCRALARWNCADLIFGASDPEVYELLHDRGWRFFILPDLHAKIFLIDRQELFVGSANLTRLGLQLVPGGNREIGVRLAATAKDVEIIDTMFSESIEMTTDLYEEFQRNVCDLKRNQISQVQPRWPTEFSQRLMVRPPLRLWVTELFWCENPNAFLFRDVSADTSGAHDALLLGLDPESVKATDMTTLRERVWETRALTWLISNLKATEGSELYFGQLSALLHDALLDDPRPYRQDVKILTANLVSWAEEFAKSRIAVDRPNYSERIRLVL